MLQEPDPFGNLGRHAFKGRVAVRVAGRVGDAPVRGRGLANRMRACILTLAFEHLGAVAAVSSARTDNPASLAVSRRLGYEDNGLSRTDTPTGVTDLQHVRLTRDRWRPGTWPVEVSGVEATLPWFGLSR